MFEPSITVEPSDADTVAAALEDVMEYRLEDSLSAVSKDTETSVFYRQPDTTSGFDRAIVTAAKHGWLPCGIVKSRDGLACRFRPHTEAEYEF